MPTRSEAEQDRAEALADIIEDGQPALLRYDKNWAASGRSVDHDWVDVELYVLHDGIKADADQGIVIGDLAPWVADASLGALAVLINVPFGGSPGPGTGFRVLLGSPEAYPSPGDPGIQEFHVLRILETVKTGGWPVIHRLHLRGGAK